MIKELWILIKMLFTSNPSDFAYKDLEVMPMNHFPFKGKTFMSWCGKMIVREENKDIVDEFLTTQTGKEVRNHEQGHVVQAIFKDDDDWVVYYLDYFWNWIKHCPWMNPSRACYYLNKYEVECFANQHDFGYFDLEKYTTDNLNGKYTIKDAKKLWKQLGGTSDIWKRYIRSL